MWREDGGSLVECSHHPPTMENDGWTALISPSHPLIELIGIEHPQKVLLQLLQWQVVSASYAILSWWRYNIDGISWPTPGICCPKDGFGVYFFHPSLYHSFSLLACHTSHIYNYNGNRQRIRHLPLWYITLLSLMWQNPNGQRKFHLPQSHVHCLCRSSRLQWW